MSQSVREWSNRSYEGNFCHNGPSLEGYIYRWYIHKILYTSVHMKVHVWCVTSVPDGKFVFLCPVDSFPFVFPPHSFVSMELRNLREFRNGPCLVYIIVLCLIYIPTHYFTIQLYLKGGLYRFWRFLMVSLSVYISITTRKNNTGIMF